MASLRHNIAANFAGQIWTALIGVVFVPVYIHWIGIEAFGLVGLYLTIQAIFALFDFGLAGTLNRELARASGGDAGASRNLLRTIEMVYACVGLLLCASLAAAAPWLCDAWLHPVALTRPEVIRAIHCMALALLCQWPSLLYAAGLNGLQRQVRANVLMVTTATLRGAGVLVPLWLIAPDLTVYFTWMAVVGIFNSVASGLMVWRLMPASAQAARFTWSRLHGVKGFSADLTLIGILSFLLMQSDRLILSRLLPLDRFGVYALAATTSVMLARAAMPWFSAMYPRLSELHAQGELPSLSRAYHDSSQWAAVTMAPLATVLALHGEALLAFWSRDAALAHAAYGAFAMLVVGYGLNGLMVMPYAVQLAYGWTRLTRNVNLVSVFLFIPAIVLLNDAFGITGAAAAWPLLNAGYLLVTVPLLHRRILPGELFRWYLVDVGPPVAAAVLAGLATLALPRPSASAAGMAGITGAYLFSAACALAAAPGCRRRLGELVQRVLQGRRS